MPFETQTLVESRVFCLALNSIYESAEQGSIVAAATSEEALRTFYEGELLKSAEMDGRYRLSFAEGPLRCCNPLDNWHHRDANYPGWNQGWFDVWVQDPYSAPEGCHFVDF
ncbi:MAG: hypothetical protein AAGK66_08955 [Pseudomonadota bacterium]